MKNCPKSLSYSIAVLSIILIGNGDLHAQLTDWNFFKNIQLESNAAVFDSNYQVLVEINTEELIQQGKMQSNGSDIRFSTDCKGMMLQDHWVESGLNSNNTQIWVRLDTIHPGVTELFMFYGNASATNTGAFERTFLNPFIVPNPDNPELGRITLDNGAFRLERSSSDTLPFRKPEDEQPGYRIGTVYLEDYDWFEIKEGDSLYIDTLASYDYIEIASQFGDGKDYERKLDSVIHRVVINARRIKIDGKIAFGNSGFTAGRQNQNTTNSDDGNPTTFTLYQAVDGLGTGGGDGLVQKVDNVFALGSGEAGGACAGGGYGGIGGQGAFINESGDPLTFGGKEYGHPTNEGILPGSGGGTSGDWHGGNGGAALWVKGKKITASDNSIIDLSGGHGFGIENVDTNDYGFGGGGGSGGGLFIDGGIVLLDGAILANGGDGGGYSAGGGGGGGGRIKLTYEETYDFSNNYTVAEGDSGRTSSYGHQFKDGPSLPGMPGTFYEGEDLDKDEVVTFVGVEAQKSKVTFTVDEMNPCEGEAIVFTSLPAGLGTYRIFKDGVLVYNGSSNRYTTDEYTENSDYHLVAGSVGCEDTTDAITINIRPVQPLILSGPNELCRSDEPTEFRANQVGGEWDGLGINRVTGILNPMVADTGLNQIFYYYTAPNGCYSEAFLEVTINHPKVTIDSILGVCDNDEAPLNLKASVSGGIWEGKGVDGALLNVGELKAGINQLLHSYTDGRGCFRKDTMVFLVNGAPEVDLGDDIVLCAGETSVINAEAEDFTDFRWSPTAGLADPTDLTTAVNPENSTNYTLTVNDALTGCSASDVIAVSRLTEQAVGIIPDTTVCEGTSLQLYTSGGDAFEWEPASIFENNRVATPLASPSVETIVTVTITGDGGCEVVKTTTLFVAKNPAIEASESIIQFCSNASTQIQMTGADVFSWAPTFGLDNPESANPEFTDAGITTYTVTGFKDACSTSLNIPVNVFSLPYLAANSELPVCEGLAQEIGVDVEDMSLISEYSWTPLTYINDGTIASPTFLSETETIVEQHITITDVNGCTNEADITVIVLPKPTAIAGDDQTICLGESVVLGGDSEGDLYTWTVIGSQAVNLEKNPVVTPTSDETYVLTAVNNIMGFPNFVCPTRDTVNIAVNPLPTLVLPSSFGICLDQEAPLPLESNGTNFLWTPLENLDDQTNKNPIFTPGAATTYTVTASDFNTSCTNTAELSVEVHEAIGLTAISDAAICENESLTVTAITAYPNVTFDWLPNSLVTGNGGSTVTLVPKSNQTFTLEVTSDKGCSVIETFDVKVNAIPDITLSDLEICNGDDVVLQPVTTDQLTYRWEPLEVFSNPLAANPIIQPDVSRTLTLTATSLEGCDTLLTSFIRVFDSVSILPLTQKFICMGDEVALEANAQGVDGATTYEWQPIAEVKNPSALNTTATPPSNTEYTLTIVNEGGCIKTAIQTVVVFELPLPKLDQTAYTVCANEAIEIGQTNAPSDWTISWLPFDKLSSNSNALTTYNPDGDAGLFPLVMTVTDANGCVNDATATISVPVPTDPNAQRLSDVCIGDQTVLMATGGKSPSDYVWEPATFINGTNAISDVNTAIKTSMTYTVTIVDEHNCTWSDSVDVEVFDLPIISTLGEVAIKEGQTFDASAIGGEDYYWYSTNDDIRIESPTSQSTKIQLDYNGFNGGTTGIDSTQLFVIGTDEQGCMASDTLNVRIFFFSAPVIPNAFTPLSGDENSRFSINVTNGFNVEHTVIYNRWGTLLYESFGNSGAWDGMYNNLLVPAGGYAYIVSGEDNNGNRVVKNGTVSVIY